MAETIDRLCKCCGIKKVISDFPKGCRKCKICMAEYKREYYNKNKVDIRRKHKEYYATNAEAVKNKVNQYRISEADKVKKRKAAYYMANKDSIYQWKKKHIEENREMYSKKWKEIRERRKDKIREYLAKKNMDDEVYRLGKNIRTRIRFALKNSGNYKSETTESLLGCSVQQFKGYFESMFVNGMDWRAFMNGEIHIDHIKPCILFDLSDFEQQKQCFNYKNLQPLWKIDNLKKGISYDSRRENKTT